MAIAAASLHSLPLKVNPLTRLAKPHFYLQNPTPSDFRENYRTPFLSLRGSEATEAIHKKVDSSFKAMDRHADKSACDDKRKSGFYEKPKTKDKSMTLFDKISALETTFTTAKNDLQALQQSVQAHLESFVQESLETTKDKAKEFFTKELETTAQTLNAQNIAQVQELFSKNLHTLAQEVSQSLDLEGISRQVARDFSDRNATNLAQTLKQILAGFKLDSKIQALETKARELTQNYKDTLDQLISDFGTAASIKLQAYLDQNAQKILATLDLAAITHAVQEKITPQINLRELERKALESAKKSIDNLLSTLESQEQILESLESKAKTIALQAMQSDEVIKMRYETALRLQSLKCFASQEIIANIIELNAKRKNYEDIITNALKGADKKIYLSI